MYMTKSKAFELAIKELNKRKERAELENEKRLQQIRTDFPDIQEVRNKMSEMGMKIYFILQNSPDPQKALEEMKKRNLEAQQMLTELLKSHNLPEDYLDVPYTCKECHDTGSNRTTGKRCDCLTILANKIWAENLCISSPIKLTSFSTIDERYFQYSTNPQKMKRYFHNAMIYAENFSPQYQSIIMRGKTGLGKTHLALAIANQVIQKGYTVLFDKAQNILEIAENEKFSKDGNVANAINMFLDVDLLVIDDFGSETNTDFARTVLYRIIDRRLQGNQPTIITTNLTFEQMQEFYDFRIVSRILGQYMILNFDGIDLRMIMRKEKEGEKPKKSEEFVYKDFSDFTAKN